MRDLPTGPALLALAREVLLRDLLPVLPDEAALDARLVASSMAIAEREAEASAHAPHAVAGELEKFYDAEGEETASLLRRLAHDLRTGAFERSGPQDHQARQILWQLTISKLRLANPRFLAANGFR